MLLLCFILKTDGSETSINARAFRRNSTEDVFLGPFSQWVSIESDIKKYRKCVICFYEGDSVLCIDRSKNKELATDLMSNAKIMTEAFPDDRSSLLFVDKAALSEIRRSLANSGAEILTEHLVPNSYLSSNKDIEDYYKRICKRELNLKTGTIDGKKMLTYRLSKLRSMALPILATMLALSLIGSFINIHTSAERERLTALMHSYSTTSDRMKHSAGDVDRVLASRGEAIPSGTAIIINDVNDDRPDGILLKSISINGKSLVIDAMSAKSEEISRFSHILSENNAFDIIEISEVKRSSVVGYMEFKVNAHIK